MRISRPAGGAPSPAASMSFTSWGFSAEGMSLSIAPITSMPPKKAAAAARLPGKAPMAAISSSRALKRISVMET